MTIVKYGDSSKNKKYPLLSTQQNEAAHQPRMKNIRYKPLTKYIILCRKTPKSMINPRPEPFKNPQRIYKFLMPREPLKKRKMKQQVDPRGEATTHKLYYRILRIKFLVSPKTNQSKFLQALEKIMIR